MQLPVINKLASIRSKSAKAISVFQKTVSDLTLANEEIDKARAVRAEKVVKIEKELDELATIRQQNSAFIGKLNDFLGLQG